MKSYVLAQTLSFQGTGLHSGDTCRIILHPPDRPEGVVFRVGDQSIPAHHAFVADTRRATVLEREGARVATVEHLLAALWGMGIHHALVEVQGPEIPAMDGSALPFAEALAEADRDPLPETPRTLAQPVIVRDGNRQWIALPAQHLGLSVSIRYPQGINQFISLDPLTPETFLKEVAPARTFVFVDEVEAIRSSGKARGGSLENTVVLGDRGEVLNPEGLRFPDEPVRHKALDVLGDLALIGVPLPVHVVAQKTGHGIHVEGVRRMERWVYTGPGLSIHEILRWIPHRFPFLLLDRILSLTGDRVVAVKNVTYNEPFFQGHFPGDPVMPGVLIVEAMAQAGGFLLLSRVEDKVGKLMYFAGMDQVRFRRPVRPGDRLILEARLLAFRKRFAKIEATAWVESEKAAEGVLSAVVVDHPGSEGG